MYLTDWHYGWRYYLKTYWPIPILLMAPPIGWVIAVVIWLNSDGPAVR